MVIIQCNKDTKLRIVSFICIICEGFNFNLIFETNEQKIMFVWLENNLSQFVKNIEFFIQWIQLIDHDQNKVAKNWKFY